MSQGTHLGRSSTTPESISSHSEVDLTRYLSPKIVPGSLQVQTVEHSDKAGRLSALKFDEGEVIQAENRIPRVTNAIWRTEVGGTVNFVHGIVLHGKFFNSYNIYARIC